MGMKKTAPPANAQRKIMQPIMQIALPVFMARNLTASGGEIKGLVRARSRLL